METCAQLNSIAGTNKCVAVREPSVPKLLVNGGRHWTSKRGEQGEVSPTTRLNIFQEEPIKGEGGEQ